MSTMARVLARRRPAHPLRWAHTLSLQVNARILADVLKWGRRGVTCLDTTTLQAHTANRSVNRDLLAYGNMAMRPQYRPKGYGTRRHFTWLDDTQWYVRVFGPDVDPLDLAGNPDD